MPRTLHLHVGMPKCASTSLQAFLAENRSGLLHEGFDYPSLAASAAGNLTPYVMSLRPDAARQSFVQGHPDYNFSCAQTNLHAALENPSSDKIILSSEGLSHPCYRPDLDWVVRMFTEVNVHVFFRPRASLIVSGYNQSLQGEKSPSDIGAFLQSPLLRSGGMFSRQLEHWQSFVGKNAVYIHFISPRFSPAIQQFMTAIGCNIAVQHSHTQRLNKSLSAFVLCALAHVNGSKDVVSVQRRHKIISLAKQFDPDPEMTLLTPKIIKQINTQFAHDTDEFIKMQSVLSRQDLETEPSPLPSSTSFEAIKATQIFKSFLDEAGLKLLR